MELTIQGHGMEMGEGFENFVRRKTARLARYLPGIEEVRIEVTKHSAKGDADKELELTIRRHRTLLRVEERNSDPFAAMDAALDKMYQRIARYKGRRIDRRHAGGVANEDAELAEAEALPSGAEGEDVLEQRVVRVKNFTTVPMSTDEAIEQMELLGHDFFVFMHADDGNVKVVYRRKTGNYGLLQPEK
ncbi:MAG: ribosome-associated translation inhibitor RaiA [Chloroflexi bacterium]|nr:ribosome-associated translation inhibitor RaiA [Chloroflexota bacterium]MCL5275012.1 ribosome-associated translation inhibitor RaiA [Chloroflexota bacterium]